VNPRKGVPSGKGSGDPDYPPHAGLPSK
jgi:hypothetical protein